MHLLLRRHLGQDIDGGPEDRQTDARAWNTRLLRDPMLGMPQVQSYGKAKFQQVRHPKHTQLAHGPTSLHANFGRSGLQSR